MSRPEHIAPPDVFYNEHEALKYTNNTRMIEVQTQLTERAIELLALPDESPRLILDIGCGSGLSGDVIESFGHNWIGVDISQAMLEVGKGRNTAGDTIMGDMGHGLPFRPGVFDGAVSISAIQWLCNADKSSHNPRRRIHSFFESLFSCLARGSRAVLQFYPENALQIELLTTGAMECGFRGGVLVDYPHSTKAKKYYLILFAGASSFQMPQALGTEDDAEVADQVAFNDRSSRSGRERKKGKRAPAKSRDWVLAKKQRQREQGRDVRPDSKYTARSRGPRF
eukprot:TRINITY_DN513_c0_g1_i1.p1 TRINITY_DN513_c0_g1~~TRINITY_DN513_c0_g1_i1.p1  ORF type:complete len:295 (-),score=82.22 TRINITY_DN513_c0_g1_i1:45-890(-)